jgi:hypothetical protein
MNKEKGTANLWMQSLDSSPGHQITKFSSGPITGFHWFLDGKNDGRVAHEQHFERGRAAESSQ